MRKVIVTSFISLDGYVAGVDGNVMALPFDPSFDNYNLDRIRSADTLLLGSTTYQQLMNFWVPLADDPTATALQREIGRFNRDAAKLVVSDTHDPATIRVSQDNGGPATRRRGPTRRPSGSARQGHSVLR